MSTEERRIYFALLTAGGIFVALTVYFVITLLQYLRRKVTAYRLTLQQEMKIQETERTRIASELHDDTSSALSVIKLRLSGIHTSRETDRKTIADILIYIDKLSDKVRSVSNELLPVVLERHGLQTALEELILPLSLSAHYQVASRFQFDNSSLLPEASIHIYRMFQEMINNIIKHSKASQLSFSVTESADTLMVEVKDNGNGFDSTKEPQGTGLGLYNIRMRTDILRAKFYLTTSRGSGTEYTIVIPKYSIKTEA